MTWAGKSLRKATVDNSEPILNLGSEILERVYTGCFEETWARIRHYMFVVIIKGN